ncbi:hypothetical protein DL96DRAFT_21295 [Flagelloscypha sp. PMI_526]|nr:hypothetical protein DL96DRAFT_21295 [Flagelloscypha sp. PMI_526]
MPPEASSSRCAPKRKHHKKSRAGCRNCKGRRVKCDEAHPICKACHRRKEACVWDDEDSPNPLAMILTPAANSTLSMSSDHQLDLPPLGEFRMKDLELLHNWTTNTLQTFIPDVPETRHGFQVMLPQLAFQHEFLLHAMFAMSSLHMHTFKPSGDWLRLAKMHCQKAILGMRKVGDSVSWDISFMANTLLATYWLASPSWKALSQDGTPDLFDWFPAARTFMRRLGPYWMAVSNGIVKNSPFLPDCLTTVHKQHMPSPFPSIVQHIHRPEICPFDVDELLDPKVIGCYEIALQKLTYTWNVFMSPNMQNIAIYLFPSSMSDDFFELFIEKRPRALILVAHYCALLGQFDGTWWYGSDRSRNDIQRIMSLLDEKWLPWMEYPMNVLRMKESTAKLDLTMQVTPPDEKKSCSSASSVSSGSSPLSLDEMSPIPPLPPQASTALWVPPGFEPTISTPQSLASSSDPAIDFGWPGVFDFSDFSSTNQISEVDDFTIPNPDKMSKEMHALVSMSL